LLVVIALKVLHIGVGVCRTSAAVGLLGKRSNLSQIEIIGGCRLIAILLTIISNIQIDDIILIIIILNVNLLVVVLCDGRSRLLLCSVAGIAQLLGLEAEVGLVVVGADVCYCVVSWS